MINKIKGILDFCLEDSSKDIYFKKETQLFLVTVKSLLPYENKVGCGINYKRFSKEIEILRYYINGDKEFLEVHVNNKLNKFDDLIEFKILPIVIANTNLNIVIEESIKSIIFFVSNGKSIIYSIALSRLLYDHLNGITDEGTLINNMKDSIISFSIKNFYYKTMNKNIENKCLIDFEKERIDIITSIKTDTVSDEFIKNSKIFKHIIFNKKDNNEIDKENKIIIDNFASYLLKLRKGLIPPEKIKIDLNNIDCFENYLKQSTFKHPLLGLCKIIKKTKDNLIIKTRTGIIKVKH